MIIEYKKVASSELINQSLYYLHWITDHKGDFQIAVNKALGADIEVDWSEIRVICLAPEYKKYDLHAVQVIGANIELWQYKLYENGVLNIEEVYRRSETITHSDSENTVSNGKNPIMVQAGKKAAETRKTTVYKLDEHLTILNDKIKELFKEIRDYIIGLDNSIEKTPKKITFLIKQAKILCALRRIKIS